jgi:CP family cyanate transporter-like MFS transporter
MPESAAPPITSATRTRHAAWKPALFVTGIIALAFNLRAAVTGVPPVFPELSSRLHLSSTAIAVLAAAPVLCFAVFAPAAAPLSRRFGEERVLLAAAALLAAGLLLRGAVPGLLLFPGTVLAAGAIAFMNVLLPSLVKRRWPARAGLLIGIYLLSLCGGAILGSLVAVPVFQASGGSVSLVLGLWAVPAIAAALVWLPQWRFRPAPGSLAGSQRDRGQVVRVSRHLLAWQVMAFMGLQSLTYYATLSWLPILFRDRGAGAVAAGTLLAVMNLGNAVTALLMPVLAHRARDQRPLVVAALLASGSGLVGVWLAPLATALAWTFLLGLGQGATLGLAIYFTTARAPDPVAAASLSAFTQGGGYLIATAGPLLVGFLHSAVGGWAAPMLALLVIFAAELLAGWHGARDRVLPSF